MNNSDLLFEVESAGINPEHFAVDAHRHIYRYMMYLKSKGVKPDPMSIMEVLQGDAKKVVEEFKGGIDYLVLMTQTYLPAENLTISIEKVKQAYTRRRMLRATNEVQDLVLSDQADVMNPGEIIGYAEQKIVDIGVDADSVDEVYKMGTDTDEVLQRRAETPNVVPGLEFGWEQYDRVTNGAQPGDLIVVVAPSKTGKSVTLTNWATKLGVIDKLPVLYIDTEMNSREQEDRILANLSGVPIYEIISGMYVMDTENGKAEEKIAAIKKAKAMLDEGQYYHVHMPQFTQERITALARKFHMQLGIVALFFDYIKIPSTQADFRTQQEYQRLGYVTGGLKEMADTLQIPVITAAQTNRTDVKGDSPDASNIGGSYRILQLASKLMFLYNKTPEQIAKDGIGAGNQQLFIKWQRNGESDCDPINIAFDKPILRQREA